MNLFLQLQAQGGGFNFSLVFPILIVGVLYFFFLRPQRKKQDDQNSFAQDLKKGDKVVTNSGIIGQISKVDEASVQLQVDGKNFITFIKGAISKEMTEQFHKPVEEKK